MKKQTSRSEALVRGAAARGLVTAFLNQSDSVFVPDEILPALRELNYTMVDMMPLLDRMVSGKLINRVAVTHVRYKYGYANKDVPLVDLAAASLGVTKDESSETSFAKRAYNKRKESELPLDIRINEKDQTLTIRAMGLRITIGKE